ncbi:MAG: hypothetical protein DCC71_06860 [Proteobacteria bacterium]|nr:MAG: hypothetical protein DCC71_06860 [Pseudomonadota bacterium]
MDAKPGHAELRVRWDALLRALPAAVRDAHVADARVLHLPAQRPPWTDTGLAVAAGDDVTLLAEGRVVLSEALDLWGAPRLFLWGRFAPGGRVWNGTRDTTTQRADRAGRVELGIYQGEWASETGELATPPEAYAALGGGYDVALIRWRQGARAGLDALRAAVSDPLLDAEAARLAAPAPPPAGWSYLWFLGPAEIFRAARRDGRDAIALHAENDLGILRKPVDFALDADTALSWSWRVDALPADRAEDTLPTHDYLSVALEFENGLDLTWTWSAALPAGRHYACPLPHWNARETHWVVRSGRDGLGVWQDESRRVLADYAQAVAAPPPQRVVAVWLIAVSIFRHGTARAQISDIALRSGARTLSVL